MSSIDYLKFLLKEHKKTDKERKEDMDLEEAYLTQAGVIPRQRTIDPKQYDKLSEGQKMQFFNPHKTYDSDDKYKAIDKLKAILNKGKFGKGIKDIRVIQDKCINCGKKMSGDVSASIGSKEYKEGRQCKNCKKQEKQNYDTVSTYDLINDPEYQRQRAEFIERRSRGENVGNFKFKKPRNKSIDKLKSLLNKDAMSELSRFDPKKVKHKRRDAKIGRKFPKDLKGTKTDVPTYNTSSGQREATLLGNTRIPVQQEKKISNVNERYNVERPSKVPYKKRVRDWHKDTQKPTSFKENVLQPRKPDKHDRDFEDRIERRDTKPYGFDHDVHTEFITMPSGRKEPKQAKIDMLRENQQDREQEKQRKINEGKDYNHRKYGHWDKILTSNPATRKLRRTVDNKKLMEQVKDKENKREAKRWKKEDPDRVYVNQSAINKLKALLAKEGETNSGEKSNIEDEERKEKESTTPANYYPNFRKYDLDDRDPEDKEIF